MTRLLFAAALVLALPTVATAHNAGASENLSVNGSTPTDRAHDAVRENGQGKHPSAEFEKDSNLDRNPNASSDE